MSWRQAIDILIRVLVATLGTALASEAATQQDRLDSVAFEQRIGKPLATEGQFLNADAEPLSLTALADDRPMILVMSWFNCPDLCPMVLDHLAAATQELGFPESGYQVAVVSIAPDETPTDAKQLHLQLRQRQGETVAGWQFLSGGAGAIEATAQSVGFNYSYDAERDRYAHPAGLVVIAPGGTISRYLFDIRPGLPDLKLALMEAAQGSLGSPAEQILLRCYRFDPETGQYNLAVIRLLQVVGGAFVGGLGVLIFYLRVRERS